MSTILFATPSLDAYGSDLQMLQSVVALREAGWRVVVTAPDVGRPAGRWSDLDVEMVQVDFPVLRRASASATGLAALALAGVRALPGMVRTLRRLRADVLYVNTVTLPWWLAAGRLVGVRTVCHAHEAEARDSAAVRRALTLPLLLAHTVIVNSRTTEQVMVGTVSRLRTRTKLVYNGVEAPDPPAEPVAGSALPPARRRRLAVVGRLSPRKAPEVALEATALLNARGYGASLELFGAAVEGMEGFADELQQRADQADLAGAVVFRGYTSPIWPALAEVDVVIAPSLGESFGNAVVEGQLAGRPVVATAVQGHLETITDGQTGLLVPCEDPEALAAAVSRLFDDPDLAGRLARQGHESAVRNFSSTRYRDEIRAVVTELATG